MKKSSTVSILLSRIKSSSFKRLNQNINAIHSETGKNRIYLFCDIAWCILRYGVGYLDYHVFGFADIHGKKRKTFITMNYNVAITRKLNDPEAYDVLSNKLTFMQKFSDFTGRQWLDIGSASKQQLNDFFKDNKTFFAKPVSDFGGHGVERITIPDGTDVSELVSKLKANRQYLIEQQIQQHAEMNKLCDKSVNTLRIVTLTADGITHVPYVLLRMGNGDSNVDNISSGGLYTLVSNTGTLEFPAFCDKTGKYYTEHPYSGTVFKGFTIPYFEDALDLCRQAAKVEPRLGYIGWDVAITADRPVLIEGNNLPGYDMAQNHAFRPDGIGLLPTFEKIIKITL